MLIMNPAQFENQVISVKIGLPNQMVNEIVGKCIGQSATSIWLHNPQALQAIASKTGAEPQIGMINFVVTGDVTKPVEIYKNHVIGIVLSKSEVVTAYEEVINKSKKQV